MVKTLSSAAVRAEVERRLAALTPEHARRWGAMPVGGMLCHLDDSYRAVMGEHPLSAASMNVPHWLAKLVGLHLPLQWRPGLPTGESLRQGAGGTPPTEFEQDRQRLQATLARFCTCSTLIPEHPFFGRMTRGNWMRWGYRHADHHLRQFNA